MAPPTTMQVIEARRGWARWQWAEIWRARELLYFFVWRDLKVRYKQTVLGVAWVVLQPLLTMALFTFVFGTLAGMGRHTGSVPYPLYVYTGLIAWNYFAAIVSHNTHALISNTHLVGKIYFPRMILLFAGVGTAMADYLIACSMQVGLGLYWGFNPGTGWLLLPVLLLGTTLMATGLGALFAALSVSYRDFRYVVPFLLQLAMYATPVIYPSALVPEQWRWILAVNPVVGLIDGFHAAFFQQPVQTSSLALSLVLSVVTFLAGTLVFKRFESRFADVI